VRANRTLLPPALAAKGVVKGMAMPDTGCDNLLPARVANQRR
jgi:hypothetical protein